MRDVVAKWLTPPELGRQIGVDPAKVIAWILSGQLAAVNCATRSTGRPRWKISPQAVEDFARRRAAPAAKRQRRPRRVAAEVGGDFF